MPWVLLTAHRDPQDIFPGAASPSQQSRPVLLQGCRTWHLSLLSSKWFLFLCLPEALRVQSSPRACQPLPPPQAGDT